MRTAPDAGIGEKIWFFLFHHSLNVFPVWRSSNPRYGNHRWNSIRDGRKDILLLTSTSTAPEHSDQHGYSAAESHPEVIISSRKRMPLKSLRQRLLSGRRSKVRRDKRDYWILTSFTRSNPSLRLRFVRRSFPGAQYQQLPSWRGSASQWHFALDVFA